MLEKFIKLIDRHAITDFYDKCCKATTKEEIYEVVDLYMKYTYGKPLNIGTKTIYNEIIGWALPSKIVCDKVVKTMKCLPDDVSIVDLGAGSGIFSHMFYLEGLPKKRIIAIDKIYPTHVSGFNKDLPKKRNFWPIHRDDEYVVNPKNVLFIAWGCYYISKIIDKFIIDGGKYIILLGEQGMGCTYPPSDYFVDKPGWKSDIIHVPGPASKDAEHLSINIRE